MFVAFGMMMFCQYFSANAQVNLTEIPNEQVFFNNNEKIIVKNHKQKHHYEEVGCTWETVHAEVEGIRDTVVQNYINDWLSGMTFFGNCDGEKGCFDIVSYHYFYKKTTVTFLKNDIASFFLLEGNCQNKNEACCENQDWEVYDLSQKRFIQEAEFFKQDNASKEIFFQLLESKVAEKGLKLVPEWEAFNRQFGLNKKSILIYLYNDVVGNEHGVVLELKQKEVEKILEPSIAKRIFD